MDSARSILMSMGIILHTANVYSINGDWIVSDISQSFLFDIVTNLIHTFRMPAFFIISGFFCALTIKKYGIYKFSKIRFKRILIPFLFTLLFLNIPQTIYTNNLNITDINLFNIDNLLNGSIIYHLWFLLYIVIYYIFIIILYYIFKKIKISKIKINYNHYIKNIIFNGFVFLSFFINLIIAYLFPSSYNNIYFLGSFYNILYYFIFFAAGYILYTYPELLRSFIHKGWMLWIFFMILHVDSFYLLDKSGILFLLIDNLKFICLVMCLVYTTLLFFKIFFNRPSKLWVYMSESSYSIYLLHHSIIVFGAIILINFNLSPFIKFGILFTITLFICLFLHEYIIRRSKILRYAFNGK